MGKLLIFRVEKHFPGTQVHSGHSEKKLGPPRGVRRLQWRLDSTRLLLLSTRSMVSRPSRG